ncbi:DNA-directed RNA polymerase subunit beta [Desulfobacter hydrogenophilus]|uniref:DNA-directed RNA polymerase subunit beta n=2 Tax=Desulfobacter TaxID=2289 RepID=A0A328FFE6_9BACT|nr:DNA-directed RNA polymerase subunit beta [Desulfobacter hydrogenophilus]NDY72324.1 DNA-directed RNA polymerase subunit beta [Desulfobacter hydrogenophilus]QBH15557.1 DNA-directed RNA polymerase subunit beta [Desulfobacter hydrogenophilus]RAM01757.1 DNA-directed RNA polymerase subunit beta [Desulfobacter hydrogenophilus]
MAGSLLTNKRVRKEFGGKRKIIDIPDLIGMQRDSFEGFLQRDVSPQDREEKGLHSVFKSVFPIKDFTDTSSLEYVSYSFGETKHSMQECISRGMTYDIPVNIRVRLVVYDHDKDTGVSTIRDIKEQEIYFGTIPLMTPRGTFIINGTERAVVSQLHRSSGVFFDHDKGKNYSSGKIIYNARIIPVRGSWIDMEIDAKDIVYIRIDRRRKFPVSILFKAFGYTGEDILDFFYTKEKIIRKNGSYFREFIPENLVRQRAGYDIKSTETGDVVVKAGRIFTKRALKQLADENLDFIPISEEDLIGKAFAGNFFLQPNDSTPLFKSGDTIAEDTFELLEEKDVDTFEILYVDPRSSDCMRKTLVSDKIESKEEALMDIYRRLRPGNPATIEVAQDFIDHLFFRQAYYDLSKVGRLKMNHRLGVNTKIDVKTLRKEDVLLTAATLIELKDTQGKVDDIDHLGNRRVRAVGELLENHYRIGLVRMERAIKEKMSMQEVDAMMPHDLINPKPVSAVVREFFGTSQLSQFMDQTNPLSETTHKRRLSALGPGGLTRERAGFEVRDVHPSHYGRICPIETPEGPNIGLIVSLCTYARVNDFGFIETPFRIVNEGNASKIIQHLSAFEEKELPIAQANAPLDADGNFINPTVSARVGGEFEMVAPEEVKFMDVSPNQLVSVSASLIPFLENDDANRALMGSNMQRQAVPLIRSEAPLVGTGMEAVVARDSGVTIVAECDGVVVDVDSKRIVVKNDDNDDPKFNKAVSIYNCTKFVRSNQNTCFNHRPIVKKNERVQKGHVIADGPSTELGELALGKNVTVAFMPWDGYNYEDSILVSERLVKDGVYTSVHVEEFEVLARDTKLGKEEITRDIPNVGEDALKNLDDSGIIRLGAEVKPGDILVGKITPKGETQLSPEEKLLRAIFGEKAGDVKDTSLCVPPGVHGKVIDAKVFSRRGLPKDDRTRQIEDAEIERFEKDRDDEIRIISDVGREKVESVLDGHALFNDLERNGKVLVKAGTKVVPGLFEKIPVSVLVNVTVEDAVLTEKVQVILEQAQAQIKQAREHFNRQVSRFEKGDDLPPGVLKLIKISVALLRVLSVGDKMAGRHGNKGVVSRILRVEDLPYFADGRPVDMVLNPLGVPSRMNVGQILEIHLGRAAYALGQQIDEMLEEKRLDALRDKAKQIFSLTQKQREGQVDDVIVRDIDAMDDEQFMEFVSLYKNGVHTATPVFDGATEEEIKELICMSESDPSGQSILYDGRTGRQFDKPVTVGTLYMLKLHHLVDDKLHARSIGPYSLVTQQPLGGKAQFGGQRLGEMEVWAMEAYGAAHALQEFLTVKSDDMTGRTRMYEKIVKGQNVLEPGMPESFRVLIKELNALGLDMNLIEGSK